MKIFYPFTTAVRTAHTITTAYVCGRVAWRVLRQIHFDNKKKFTASELRERFIDEYKAEHGHVPQESVIQSALRAYDVAEKPLIQKAKKFVNAVGEKISACVDDWFKQK